MQKKRYTPQTKHHSSTWRKIIPIWIGKLIFPGPSFLGFNIFEVPSQNVLRVLGTPSSAAKCPGVSEADDLSVVNGVNAILTWEISLKNARNPKPSPFGQKLPGKILRGLYFSPMFFDKVVMVVPVWWQLKLLQIQKSWNSDRLGSFSRIFVEMFHAAKHSNLDRQKWNMINHPFLHSGVPSWNHICFPAFPPKSLPIKERIKAYRCLMMIFGSSHGASF